MNKKQHPLYIRWYSMMQRCYNENRKNYKHYGGRGITVDQRWQVYFFEHTDKLDRDIAALHEQLHIERKRSE